MSSILRQLSLLAVALSFVVLGGCSAAPNDPDSDDLVGAPEEVDSRADGVTGSIPVGSKLVSTANVNLRTGPSTSKSILHVVAEGAQVTVVEAAPNNGFYKVNHGGTVGWSFGQYYKVVSSGGGACSVAGVAGTCLDTGACGAGHHATPGYCPGAANIQCCTPDSADNDPPSSTRAQAIERAKSGKGFSYWWGHGRFRDEGPTALTKGSCSGSCPNCSHSGSYGGDCSGYVGKIWQVPGSNDQLSVDSHPYSTVSFNSDTSQWSTVSRANVEPADAMVYNSNGAGHIFLYASGDGWNSMYAYECKGCSYGCIAGYRTASSAYHAIARKGY